MDALQYFASRQMRLRFDWGQHDCVTLPADWVEALTGHDPMADLRGRYHSLASCQRLTRFLTDPVAAIGDRLGHLPQTSAAALQRGDVGIVLTLAGGEQRFHGGICLGAGKWLLRDLAGVAMITPRKVIAGWSTGFAARAAAGQGFPGVAA